MTRLEWGLAIWAGGFLAVFLMLELPAHYRLVPWPTLSSTVWIGIRDWHPVGYFVALAVLVLLGHLEWHWSAAWLIGVSALGATLIGLHILTR